MKTILCVVGTRPELIKMAPVIRALKERVTEFRVIVCSTGQHQEMMAQMLKIFDISFDVRLDVMTHDQSLTGLTASVMVSMQAVIDETEPDWVVVQGDTTTAMAAALVSFYRGVAVAHVEAGLRTGNNLEPFPEEVNRRIIDATAYLHFPPTDRARDNLLKEGASPDRVILTGNTAIDSLMWAMSRYDLTGNHNEWRGRRVILVTAHRRESFGEPLANVCRAIKRIVVAHPDVHVVFPVHLNPNVQNEVRISLGGVEQVSLLPPLDYLGLVSLMIQSHLIMTDSGGIQEEAPTLGKPVLVLRARTERPEAVEAGAALIVGTNVDKIVSETSRLLTDSNAYAGMARKRSLFGDGHASARIADALRDMRMTGS